ncbi:MAG: Dyp-type peroxidase [Actinomycetota bacterium]|nr:Dyp-type peroxidase [Actinomycetota bacterium]
MPEALELSDIQGLLARGYGNLPAARFLILSIDDPAAASPWLASLAEAVTSAEERPSETSVQLAFTRSGLDALGLPPVDGMSVQFVEGMVTPHRSRVLGDLQEHSPERWAWGGPATQRVGAILLLYASAEETLSALADRHRAALPAGVRVVTELDTFDIGDFEHFGFRDGISQPPIEGLSKAGTGGGVVSAGEFVLGYTNEYGLRSDRPLIHAGADPKAILPRDAASAGADFGRNGTYLVVRQLSQDVPRFWRYLDSATRPPEGRSDPAARVALAAKIVGRWPSGAPLVRSPDRDDPALSEANDFDYFQQDRFGHRCPLGAHIRRAAPRDSLDPNPGSAESVAVANRHRLLRRGREYGPPLTMEEALADEPPDVAGEDRGLHFMCLNGNLARQFEFVQHTWINDRHFNGLYGDVDPIAAHLTPAGSTYTVQADPVRRRATEVPSFITVKGGAYFFMPGIRAIRYLASLGG